MTLSESEPPAYKLISTPAAEGRSLFPRKGGGGGGKGGSSKGGGSKGSKSGSSASSAAKKNGASDAFVDSRGAQTFAVTGTGSTAYAYSDGGGKHATLGTSSAFSGREAGGGSRSTIYGTSRFGSGYPYGGYGSYVDSRPLPYYFYPVPVCHGYYGGDEYLNVNDSQRPGGNLITAIVQPSYNTSSTTYRLVGDNSSVVAVFDALVANCTVANSSVFARFEPSNTTWPLPEQIVQYYRASSFALSLDGYNNTASLPANAPTSNNSSPVRMADTPLPSGLNMTFLQCLNYTIGASVPLAVAPSKGLSGKAIAGIVIGSILGLIFITIIIVVCCGTSRKRRRDRKDEKRIKQLGDGPTIRVIETSDPKSLPPSSKSFFDKGKESTSRPISMDERTLTADPFDPKNRWSYASSSASSRTNVDLSIDGQDSKKIEERSSFGATSEYRQDVNEDKSSWLPKMPFPGHNGYQSVKHQSTSSIELPLTDQRRSYDLGTSSERNEIVFPSPSYSPSHSRSSSRCPSPSPSAVIFPLIPGDERRHLG